jgi:replicative DNA helicase
MDRVAQLTIETQVLGALCKREDPHDLRAELVRVLEHYTFLEPEHQIVFESIRSLLLRDRLSMARLAVHLNNRGFPDVDLEKYCAAAFSNIEEAVKLARRMCSLTDEPGAGVRDDNQGKVKHDI